MSEEQTPGSGGPEAERQPILLLPGVVTALCGVLVAVHVARVAALGESGDYQLLLWLAFIPVRALAPAEFPGGLLPLLWTPFTHALLHAGWDHLAMNTVWLAIFATPVARRYGAMPTATIFLVGAAVGALAFAVTTLPQVQVLVGASGGVAALTGAAVRFIFQPVLVAEDPETGRRLVLGRRLARLGELFRDPRARWFTIIWVVLNAAVPLAPLLIGAGIQIAWQAHLGGFFAGLLMVGLFEKRPKGNAE